MFHHDASVFYNADAVHGKYPSRLGRMYACLHPEYGGFPWKGQYFSRMCRTGGARPEEVDDICFAG